MSPKQKYRLAFRTIVDPTTFVVLAGVAGAEQYNGTYPGYGPGITGYGKRYGAALADSVSGRIIGSADPGIRVSSGSSLLLPGFRADPSRTWHALSSAVVTRADNGKLQPNYSHLLGNLAAGGIANAYHPESQSRLGTHLSNARCNDRRKRNRESLQRIRPAKPRAIRPRVCKRQEGRKLRAEPPLGSSTSISKSVKQSVTWSYAFAASKKLLHSSARHEGDVTSLS